MIRFTRHALEKFTILRRHGFIVSKAFVIHTVEQPELVETSRLPMKIAQLGFDNKRVLRVVYKEVNDGKIIITFYPGRRSQYEKK